MAEDFNEQLKAFSDKHGAVLLGMHHEIKAMQANVDETSAEVKEWVDNIYADVQAKLSRSEKELFHIQVVSKQLDERIASAVETERLRFANLSGKVEEFIYSQTLELNKYKKLLDVKQLEVRKLHEASLALLSEQKKREITHIQKIEQLRRTFNKIGLAILVVLSIGVASMWVLKWMQ